MPRGVSADDDDTGLVTASASQISFNDLQNRTEIASGTFGAVLKAEMYGTVVAIKRNFKTNDHNVEKYIKREVSTLQQIHHPNIVQFLGISIDPESKELYLVTEFVEGGNLAELIDNHSAKLSWKRVTSYARDVAAAMAYLHAQRVVHRDLKAANLLLEKSSDRVKVCDFGLSRRQESTGLARMTLCGTDDYMAPEVIMGEDYNEKADVFSYGIVMYELVTRLPPAERHPKDCFRFDTDEFHQSCPPSVPPLLAQVVVDCCNFEPDVRPRFTDVLPMLSLVFEDKACTDDPISLAFGEDAAAAAASPAAEVRKTKLESPHRQSRFETRSRRDASSVAAAELGQQNSARPSKPRKGAVADSGTNAMNELEALLGEDTGQLTLRILGKKREKKSIPLYDSSTEARTDVTEISINEVASAAAIASPSAESSRKTRAEQCDATSVAVVETSSSTETTPVSPVSDKAAKKSKKGKKVKKTKKAKKAKGASLASKSPPKTVKPKEIDPKVAAKAAADAGEQLWDCITENDTTEDAVLTIASKVLEDLLASFGEGASGIITSAVRSLNSGDDLTLLHAAAALKFSKVVALLRDAGAKVKAQLPPHRFYPIHTACEAGSCECVKELLVSSLGRGTLELTDMAQETPLMVAMRHRHWDVASLLLDEGASVNTYDAAGRSPMWHVARSGGQAARDLALRMLDLKTEVDRADNEGKTPLFHAISVGDDYIATLLCERGADLNRYHRYMFSKNDRSKSLHERLLVQFKKHDPDRVRHSLRLGNPRAFLADNESTKCLCCSSEFTPLRRRHHCRVCGLLMCDDCTKKRLAVPEIGFEQPVRVCKNCFGIVREMQVADETKRATKARGTTKS